MKKLKTFLKNTISKGLVMLINAKGISILVVVTLVVGGTVGVVIYNNNLKEQKFFEISQQENENTNLGKFEQEEGKEEENKNDEYIYRYFAMQEFGDSLEKNAVPPEEVAYLEESPEFELENRMEVIEYFDDLDNALCVINGVTESFSYLDIITEGLEEFELTDYFDVNKDTIFKIYGIKDEKAFEEFITPIINLGELKKFVFHLDSIEKLSNHYKVDVEIRGEKGTCTIPLQATLKIDTLTSNIMVLGGEYVAK